MTIIYYGIQKRMGMRQGKHQFHQENHEYKMKVDICTFEYRMEV